MKALKHIRVIAFLFILMFTALAVYLVYIVDEYGNQWFSSPYNTRVTQQRSNVSAGRILDRNGVVLAYTDDDGVRRYSANDDVRLAVSHIIGDARGQTLGVEAMFAKTLLGFETKSGERLNDLVTQQKSVGGDVKLSIDSSLCVMANKLLGEHRGAIVVMNYKTGEVLAMVSKPDFDNARIDDFLAGTYQYEDSTLVNRATMGRYTPGSTFKLVTLVAALRYMPNVTEREFNCSGQLMFDSKTGSQIRIEGGNTAYLKDFEEEYHDTITLKDAFAHSCNNTFATLALELGSGKILKIAKELYFNREFVFKELVAYTGTYTVPTTDFELAWSGVGQHKDIITPLHACLLAASVANNGNMPEPILHAAEQDELAEVYAELFKGNECEIIKEYMRAAVEYGTAKKAGVEGYTVCGKTGTAEVSSNKEVLPHSWFLGFIDDEANPYAISVIVENAGGGGAVAAPIAGEIFSYIIAQAG